MPQGLAWGRLDTSWPGNRKFRTLRDRKQWHAIVVYFAALAHSVGQGTDGYIAPEDLGEVWATTRDVEHLLAVGLWDVTPDEHGWMVHDFAEYQQTIAVTLARRDQASKAALKRWHPQ